jgi:mediator of RNA polymerase II transcription subunit 6
MKIFKKFQLSAVHNMQSAFDETLSFSRYHPSKGYSWDFKEKSLKTTTTASKKEAVKEEQSSMFQRQRVDLLLNELTRKFPIKMPPQPSSNAVPQEQTKQSTTGKLQGSV